MGKYHLQHTKAPSTHSIGNIELNNSIKDSTLHSMENNIRSEPLNEWNMCRRENIVLCDKCSGENLQLSESSSKGRGSIVSQTQLDHRNPTMSDNRRTRCTGRHGKHSSREDPSKHMSDNRDNLQEDYSLCTGGHGILSLTEDSSKRSVDLQCTCRITHHQSQSSLSSMDKNLSIHLTRLKCSRYRPLTDSNLNVINYQKTPKKRESIPKTFYKRTEEFPLDILSHSSPTVACRQKDRYIHGKSDELTVFQLSDIEYLSHEYKEFTQKLCDKQAFHASTKCSSAIPK